MKKSEEKKDHQGVAPDVAQAQPEELAAGSNAVPAKTAERVDILAEASQRPVKKDKETGPVKAVAEVKARARFLRVSPKKVKLVVDLVRGLSVERAVAQLNFLNKGAAEPVLKLLNSAVANAEHNFKLNKADLFIKYLVANQGPTLHRWKPAAFGRAHPINKRTTHLDVILGVRGGVGEPAAKPKGRLGNNKTAASQKVAKPKKSNAWQVRKAKKHPAKTESALEHKSNEII